MRAHEAAELFPLLTGDALNVLVESMKLHGYDKRKPVVVLDGKVLDGRNRLHAAKLAGVEPVIVEAPANCDPFQESWKHNGARRDIEPDHKAAIYLKILDASGAWQDRRRAREARANAGRSQAAKEQVAKQSRDAKGRVAPGAVSRDTRPREEPKRARVELAKAAGVSPATIARAEALKKKAPERFEAVASGKAKAHKELGILKRLERVERINEASAVTPLSELGRFPVIYADPPWRYDHQTTENRRTENHYPTLPLAEIFALPVAEIATPDSVLFLWATMPLLPEALQVIDAWGFRYRTGLVWVKDKIGMGFWARMRHELLLIAVRGQMPTPLERARPDSVIEAPRTTHSTKPRVVYDYIEQMFPELKRVELFARERRDGWAAWGNEAHGGDR
jgi:N6-adenosine-specific RNA methylase IME4/ParB-like chromosome segregation protein Spo0J